MARPLFADRLVVCRLPWHEIDSAKRHLLLEKVQNKKVETTLEVSPPPPHPPPPESSDT